MSLEQRMHDSQGELAQRSLFQLLPAESKYLTPAPKKEAKSVKPTADIVYRAVIGFVDISLSLGRVGRLRPRGGVRVLQIKRDQIIF